MGKDQLGVWLEGLVAQGCEVHVQEPTDPSTQRVLEDRGLSLYSPFARDALTDGRFSQFLSGFDGNLVHYSLVNRTIARRVANSLSTRFATAVCASSPIIVPSAATFAKEFVDEHGVGIAADRPEDIIDGVVENSSRYRANWRQRHMKWAGESYASELSKVINVE